MKGSSCQDAVKDHRGIGAVIHVVRIRDIDFSRGEANCGPPNERGVWQRIQTRGGTEIVGEF